METYLDKTALLPEYVLDWHKSELRQRNGSRLNELPHLFGTDKKSPQHMGVCDLQMCGTYQMLPR